MGGSPTQYAPNPIRPQGFGVSMEIEPEMSDQIFDVAQKVGVGGLLGDFIGSSVGDFQDQAIGFIEDQIMKDEDERKTKALEMPDLQSFGLINKEMI